MRNIFPVVLTTLVLSIASANAQNLITNGSFETLQSTTWQPSNNASWYYCWDGTPGLTPTGWTGTFPTYTGQGGGSSWIAIAHGNPHSVAQGAQSLAIDPGTSPTPAAQNGNYYLRMDTLASITQTVVTTPGQSYDLSFWVGTNADTPAAPSDPLAEIGLSVGGVYVSTYSSTTPAYVPGSNGLDWFLKTYSFTATGTSTDITFAGVTDSDLGGNPYIWKHSGLDNISLTESLSGAASAPEPGTLALIVLGGIRFLLKRRK
jgi:hypothetical protein